MDKRDPDSQIARHDAVELIASRIGRNYETAREVQNRISHIVGYAIEQGHLKEMAPGVFLLREFGRWAREKWPGKFDILPRILQEDVLECAEGADASKVAITPATLERAIQLIKEFERNRELLQEENNALKTENQALKPDAEAKQRQRTANQKNGGKRYK